MIIIACFVQQDDYNFNNVETNSNVFGNTTYSDLGKIQDYSGEICVMINNNKPYFNENDYTTNAFENYSERIYLFHIMKEKMKNK